MFERRASISRQFILAQSLHVLREDSGIPVRYFDPSIRGFEFYGTYRKPISSFKDNYQADPARIYATGWDIKPLPSE